jgi:hypothetical protein
VVASFYAFLPAPLLAQVADRLDARSDGQDARNDALLATPNLVTQEPLSNLYSVVPGLEQQAAAEAALDPAPADARHRSSRIFELRAACDLARLWADRGQPRKAHNLLAPIYS